MRRPNTPISGPWRGAWSDGTFSNGQINDLLNDTLDVYLTSEFIDNPDDPIFDEINDRFLENSHPLLLPHTVHISMLFASLLTYAIRYRLEDGVIKLSMERYQVLAVDSKMLRLTR